MDRLRTFYLLTQEPVDAELLSGRLDRERCANLLDVFCQGRAVDAAYLCGPEAMILSCKEALIEADLPESDIRFELFTTAGAKNAPGEAAQQSQQSGETVKMRVVLDGVTTSLELSKDKSLLDAALDAGLDAPYSCLGGVCCTCRAKLVEGEANMAVNYALEPGEVERGYVLACQAHVEGDGAVVLDFDQQ